MNSAPVLTTDRFELWRPAMGDLDGLVALLAHDETVRFLGPARAEHASQFQRLMANAGCWDLYGYGNFLARLPGKPDIIASCGVFPSWRGYGPEKRLDNVAEAGWIVRHDWVRQGVASEVMQAALGWFDANHGPRRVACMIEQGNDASLGLAAKLGFVRYGEHHLDDDDCTLILLERLPQAASA